MAVLLSNLANSHLNFGLFGRGREELDRVEHMDREMGTRLGLAYCLDARGTAHLELGEIVRAEQDLRESLTLARETGDRRLEAASWSIWRASCAPAADRRSDRFSADGGRNRLELGLVERAWGLAWLGAAYLARGDVAAAQDATARAVPGWTRTAARAVRPRCRRSGGGGTRRWT